MVCIYQPCVFFIYINRIGIFMESSHDLDIITFAKQLAGSNLEPGQYDLIMKEYIRLHKNTKEQKNESISFLEWIALLACIFGTIFLGLYLHSLNGKSNEYLITAIFYFIVLLGILFFKGKACSK